MFAIRVNVGCSIGIGHLVRMSFLAEELIARKQKVIFVLDQPNRKINKFIQKHEYRYLVKAPPERSLTEVEDAQKFLDVISDKPIDVVVLDSYLLGVSWEARVASRGYRIAVFDDTNIRPHVCDLLFDQTYTGRATQKRYESLVDSRCSKYLGTDYVMIDPKYIGVKKLIDRPKKNKKSPFTFTISLGGGGDMKLVLVIARQLLSKSQKNIRVICVVGPVAQYKEVLYKLADDSRIFIAEGRTSLFEIYDQTDFYIGALGTSFYELSAFGIPSLTFSLNESQMNDASTLEYFGHYFHLDLIHESDCKSIANLALLISKYQERVLELRETGSNRVDGLGVSRVADALCGEENKEPYVSGGTVSTSKKNYTNLTEEVAVRPIHDTDINHFLKSRSLSKNSKNMIVSKPISKIEHFEWWFTNNRKCYVVESRGEKKLYIWEELILHKQREYLIGGWFVADEQAGSEFAALALKWQLDNTSKIYPKATWIAVIKKTNRYVNLLNKYMGFTSVVNDDEAKRAIEICFPHAGKDEFNYLKLSP